MKVHEHQRILQQIIQLGKDFLTLNKTMSKDKDFVTLTKAYGKLDAEIKASIISAAESIGQTDFRYQRSPELTLARQTVRLWWSSRAFGVTLISRRKWFHIAKLNELCEFNEGLLCAHGKSQHG